MKEPLELQLMIRTQELLAMKARSHASGSYRYDSLLDKAVAAVSGVRRRLAEGDQDASLREQNALLERLVEVLENIDNQLAILEGTERSIPVASADIKGAAEAYQQMEAEMGTLERIYGEALACRDIREAAIIKAMLAVYPDMLERLDFEYKVHQGMAAGAIQTFELARQSFEASKQELAALGLSLLGRARERRFRSPETWEAVVPLPPNEPADQLQLRTTKLGEQIMNENLLEKFPYLAIMHPVHLAFVRSLPFNSLDYFLGMLEGMSPELRAELLPILYREVGLIELDELQSPRVKRDSPEAFEEFCRKCHELSAQLVFDRLLVTGLTQVALEYLFHLGDTTGVEDTRKRLAFVTKAVNSQLEQMGQDMTNRAPDEWVQNHLEHLPEQTARYYGLYVEFCEGVVRKLFDEPLRNIRKSRKPQSVGEIAERHLNEQFKERSLPV